MSVEMVWWSGVVLVVVVHGLCWVIERENEWGRASERETGGGDEYIRSGCEYCSTGSLSPMYGWTHIQRDNIVTGAEESFKCITVVVVVVVGGSVAFAQHWIQLLLLCCTLATHSGLNSKWVHGWVYSPQSMTYSSWMVNHGWISDIICVSGRPPLDRNRRAKEGRKEGMEL